MTSDQAGYNGARGGWPARGRTGRGLFLFRLFPPAALLLAAGCRSLAPLPAYDVEVRGAADRAMIRDVRALSDAYTYREVPVGGSASLERRVSGDAETVRRYLRSRGFYGAQVEVRVFEGSQRPVVEFDLRGLDHFIIGACEWVYTPSTPFDSPEKAEALGRPATFAEIREEGRRQRRRLQAAGFPLASVVSREAVADHAVREVQVSYVLDTGPPARFGPLAVEHLNNVRESFVRNLVPWSEGESYSIELVEEFRRRLARSGLFGLVEISGAETVAEDGAYPIRLRLRELRRQSVRVGLEYRTDEGFELSAGWLFRNLMGSGERLEINAILAEERKRGEVGLTIPQVFNPRQSLILTAGAEDEQRAVYESRTYRTSARFDREWSAYVVTRAGTALRWSEIQDRRRTEEYWLLSFPLQAVWNRRDEAINPTRGFHLLGLVEPFFDLKEQSGGFVKSRADTTRYQRLRRDDSLLLAFRGAVGSVAGAGVLSLPADERFYAGGSQSIRGYRYQTVGPQRDGEPTGGRSLVEVSLELRGRWRDFGAVLFVDGGQAYEDVIVDIPGSLAWGAGFGLRYFTALGPVRADVGVPLNPPDYLSDSLQFYLSIGQAF